MKRVLVLSLYSPIIASTRYRFMQFIDPLKERGIELDVNFLLGESYFDSRFGEKRFPFFNVIGSIIRRLVILKNQRTYDCAIVHCELFPFLPGWVERSLLRIPYIYDFDDAFYLRYKTKSFSFKSLFLHSKFDVIISGASAVTAGNAILENYAKFLNAKTTIVPTTLDTDKYYPKYNIHSPVLTIGWIGSPSTAPYLEVLIEPLSRLGNDTKVVFIVIGGTAPHIPNIEVKEIPWSELTEIDYINTFDVGVMPLPDNEWTRGKCAFKLIQYMSCSVPVVASPVGTNSIVVNEDCGIFADRTEDWLGAFRYMRDHPNERVKMGVNGRERIVREYSLLHNIPLLEKTLTSVCK